MKINQFSGNTRFPEDKGKPESKIRDPKIEDLPREMGKEVTEKIPSLLSQNLGTGETMKNKVKKVETALFASDKEFEKVVGDLADAFIADLKEKKVSDLEPFEAYATKVRQDLFLKCKDFKKRFLSGYEALQGPINKEGWAKEEEKNIPPGTIL